MKVTWRSERSVEFALWRFAMWVAWPVVTLLALQVFRASMRRARVKTEHVVRCVVYSFDVLAWLSLALFGWTLLAILAPGLNANRGEDANVVLLTTAALVILATVRLATAYRRYMRFDQAYSTVVASQVMAVLLGAIVLLIFSPFSHLVLHMFW